MCFFPISKEKVRDNLAKTIRNQNSLKTFLIVLNIVLVIVAFFSIYQLTLTIDHLVSWLLLPVSIILFILFVYLIRKKITPKVKLLIADKDEIIKKINELYSIAWNQMKPLNDLF